MRAPGNILWTGSESNVWDVASTANFMNMDNLLSDVFVTGDKVHLDDTASKFSVSLAGELEPDSVIVGSDKAYTFTGSGCFTGNATLVKLFSGMLTIRNDNSYTGGNRISGGVVSVSSLANANQAKGNLGAVTTAANKFVIENGGELRTTAAVTNGSAIKFEGDDGGVINNQQDFISDRAMSGTTLTKKGTGWMKLNVSNSALNKLVIVAGTVQCINAATPAKTVEYQGGTLNENTSTSYNIFVPKGKTGTWYMANRSTYSNKVTGEGTLIAYCTTEKGTNYYATRTPVQCNFSEFEGTLKPMSSQDGDVKRFTLNTSTGMPKGTMNIATDVEVQNSGKTFRIGKVTGTGKLGGSCTFSNGTSVGANTWQVGNDEDWATSVKVTSNANFVKMGAGTITWNGVNDNTGNTSVNEGELCIGTATMLGTGSLTVGTNGTLSCKSKTKTLTNSSTSVKGTLAVTATSCATATNAGCTTFNFSKKLIVDGTIRVSVAGNHTLQVGDSIRIFTAASFSGTPKFEFEGDVEWDTSRISEGLLFVKGVNTAIDAVITETTPKNIYDIRGRLVRRNATNIEGLPAGVYVCEGRKFVVR